MHGLRLAGKIKCAVYNSSDVLGGYFDGGNTTELSLNADGEDIDIISTDYASHGAALDSMSDPKPTTGTWKINRFTYRTLALMCAGVATALSVAESASKTKNDFAVTLGEGQRIATVPISNLVVKDETDAVTYVLDTHYSVNEQLAIVTPIAGGGLTNGAILHLTYKEAAQSGYEIAGSTALGQRIWLGLDGRNLFTNEKVLLIIPMMKLKPAGTISWVGTGDAAEATFEFTAILKTGESAPYKLRVQS